MKLFTDSDFTYPRDNEFLAAYYESERDATRDEITGQTPRDKARHFCAWEASHEAPTFDCPECCPCDECAGLDDTHDASCWVTDRCDVCGECRHICERQAR